MIDVKELKIGNYIDYSLSNLPQRIKSIIFSSEGYVVNFLDSDFANSVEKIKPIPITEEWLLKFGFISNPYQDRYELNNIYFQGCKLCFECDKTKGFTELWIYEFPNIKYVHQLQNLFHIVTGSELQLVKNGT